MGLAKRSHIAAKGYLKGWAEGGVLGVGWVNRDGPTRLAPSKVAVRSGFYLDQNPDGSANDWFETQMGRVESKALTALRRVETDWPIDAAARAALSEFLGLQYLRSPAHRRWYVEAIQNATNGMRRGEGPDLTEDQILEVEATLATDRERHLSMAEKLPVAGTVFMNMHWTLLRCGSPRLATSDHPLVPVTVGQNQPVTAISPTGLTGIAEVRFAVSPRLLLLLTWRDEYDHEPILKMPHNLVRNHNTLVIAQAEEQWFYHPSRRAEHAKRGSWPSLVSQLPGMRGVTPLTRSGTGWSSRSDLRSWRPKARSEKGSGASTGRLSSEWPSCAAQGSAGARERPQPPRSRPPR